MEVLIKNATLIDAEKEFMGDVYIKDGIIKEVAKNINKDCEIIEADGLTLMPAFVDLHVHFRDPGFTNKEDIETGSRAAVKGGYTTVNLMANTNPVCSTMKTVDYVRNKAKRIGLVDVHQVVSITRDFGGKDVNHLDSLDKSIKFISEDGKDVMDSKIMMEAMFKAKQKGITVMCHCENHELSTTDMRLAENTMTWRNITLGQYTDCPIHICHVSTKEAMQYIIDAKEKGIKITCEVAPHHIAFTSEESNYRVNPPIRNKEDVNFVINAIEKGYVDAIATDHAPHTMEDKLKGAPGMVGLETSFSVCYTKLVKNGHITLNKLSEIMSKKPAQLMEINKGIIKEGYEADLVLVDRDVKYKIDSRNFASKSNNTPFEGKEVYGKIVMTLKGGKKVYEDKER